MVPPKLLLASMTACFCSGVLSPFSPCGCAAVAFSKRDRAAEMSPKTCCSWNPAALAASNKFGIKSARRCSWTSTFAHFPLTFCWPVVSVLYPQPLADKATRPTIESKKARRLIICSLPASSVASASCRCDFITGETPVPHPFHQSRRRCDFITGGTPVPHPFHQSRRRCDLITGGTPVPHPFHQSRRRCDFITGGTPVPHPFHQSRRRCDFITSETPVPHPFHQSRRRCDFITGGTPVPHPFHPPPRSLVRSGPCKRRRQHSLLRQSWASCPRPETQRSSRRDFDLISISLPWHARNQASPPGPVGGAKLAPLEISPQSWPGCRSSSHTTPQSTLTPECKAGVIGSACFSARTRLDGECLRPRVGRIRKDLCRKEQCGRFPS